MWISKKKYNELVEQRDNFNKIANDAVAQNGRLLDEWHNAIEEMKDIQRLSHSIVRRNDELTARCKELEAKLNSVTRHTKLADDTIFAIEDALYRQKGDDIIQLHIDEYYEEVELLDIK